MTGGVFRVNSPRALGVFHLPQGSWTETRYFRLVEVKDLVQNQIMGDKKKKELGVSPMHPLSASLPTYLLIIDLHDLLYTSSLHLEAPGSTNQRISMHMEYYWGQGLLVSYRIDFSFLFYLGSQG